MFQKHLYCCWLGKDFAENNTIIVILGNNESFYSLITLGFHLHLIFHHIMQQKFSAVCLSVTEIRNDHFGGPHP